MKDFNKLSKRQRNILSYMQSYIDEHGYPPTIREIGLATDINSTSVVNYNLNKLVDAGYLERSDRVSRGMRLVAPIPGVKRSRSKVIQFADTMLEIPLRGEIVAGEPVPAYAESAEDVIEVTPAMLGKHDSKEVYALRVNGDSMIDAMIADGDIVLLRRQETANNGDMVAVWLDERGETTLKHFYNEGERVRLQPANPYLDAIYVDTDKCHVQGKVVSVLRQVR
ncbi:MAG: transcriptional repressor LexA [Anaerolineae bacterium]|nr:transcriptional repressor LexA [Anaerolineae bacterium]